MPEYRFAGLNRKQSALCFAVSGAVCAFAGLGALISGVIYWNEGADPRSTLVENYNSEAALWNSVYSSSFSDASLVALATAGTAEGLYCAETVAKRTDTGILSTINAASDPDVECEQESWCSAHTPFRNEHCEFDYIQLGCPCLCAEELQARAAVGDSVDHCGPGSTEPAFCADRSSNDCVSELLRQSCFCLCRDVTLTTNAYEVSALTAQQTAVSIDDLNHAASELSMTVVDAQDTRYVATISLLGTVDAQTLSIVEPGGTNRVCGTTIHSQTAPTCKRERLDAFSTGSSQNWLQISNPSCRDTPGECPRCTAGENITEGDSWVGLVTQCDVCRERYEKEVRHNCSFGLTTRLLASGSTTRVTEWPSRCSTDCASRFMDWVSDGCARVFTHDLAWWSSAADRSNLRSFSQYCSCTAAQFTVPTHSQVHQQSAIEIGTHNFHENCDSLSIPDFLGDAVDQPRDENGALVANCTQCTDLPTLCESAGAYFRRSCIGCPVERGQCYRYKTVSSYHIVLEQRLSGSSDTDSNSLAARATANAGATSFSSRWTAPSEPSQGDNGMPCSYGDNTCPFANDGECDVASRCDASGCAAAICPAGTDTADCCSFLTYRSSIPCEDLAYNAEVQLVARQSPLVAAGEMTSWTYDFVLESPEKLQERSDDRSFGIPMTIIGAVVMGIMLLVCTCCRVSRPGAAFCQGAP